MTSGATAFLTATGVLVLIFFAPPSIANARHTPAIDHAGLEHTVAAIKAEQDPDIRNAEADDLFVFISGYPRAAFSDQDIDAIGSLLANGNARVVYPVVQSLEYIGPRARRLEPVLKPALQDAVCWKHAHHIPNPAMTTSTWLYSLAMVLKIHVAPMVCPRQTQENGVANLLADPPQPGLSRGQGLIQPP